MLNNLTIESTKLPSDSSDGLEKDTKILGFSRII